ncbi:MAG: TetR/AcrR family transcriptional regulator [Silicimonas sp.]|nr:TetR/AcrR family transcriptional regulator [Silicimonas sp.]
MPPELRREEFLEKATEFFAEDGFSITTRELARRLDVTQPLLYRYFRSKDALISEVFETVYHRRWREEWDLMLIDRSKDLRTRLSIFYRDYSEVVFERTLLRVFLYAGLKEPEMSRRCLERTEQHLLTPILQEYRQEKGLATGPISVEEAALASIMHGGINDHALRAEVFQAAPEVTLKQAIETAIDMMFSGLDRHHDQRR